MSSRGAKKTDASKEKVEEPKQVPQVEEESGAGGALMVSQLLLFFFFLTTVALVVVLFFPVLKMQPWSNPALTVLLVKTQFLRVIDDAEVFPYAALNAAAREGDASVARALAVEKGVSAAWTDDESYLTPLHAAVEAADLDMVSALLESLRTPNVKDGVGYSLLHWAAYRPWVEGLELLLKKEGVMVDAQHPQTHITPLHMAAQASIDTTKLLVAAGANVNARGLDNGTPIFRAIGSGKLDIAQYLAEQGADITVVDAQGVNAFQLACSSGSAQMIDWVSKQPGVSTKAPAGGKSLFHTAFFQGLHETSEWLASHGYLDTSKNPEYNITPVEFAVRNNWKEGLKLLIDNGADIKTDNARFLEIANERDFKEIAEMLATTGFAGIPL